MGTSRLRHRAAARGADDWEVLPFDAWCPRLRATMAKWWEANSAVLMLVFFAEVPSAARSVVVMTFG